MFGSPGATEWVTIITVLVSLVGAFGGVGVALSKVKALLDWVTQLQKDHLQSVKELKKLREFIKSRGRVEAALMGYANLAGRAFIVQPEIRLHYGPIQEFLWQLGQEATCVKDSDSLFLRIQTATLPDGTALMDWLEYNICKPLKIYQGGCVAIALEIAREQGRAQSA